MSLTAYRYQLHDALLQFLWRQWSQLGLAGSAAFTDRWIIDPEPLLLVSLAISRFDPRLFDEILDWSIANERWISVQRIKNLARAWNTELPDPQAIRVRSLGAFAGVMHANEHRLRWKSLIAEPHAQIALTPLFLDLGGSPLPILGMPDPLFAAFGLQRPPLAFRHLSTPIPLGAPPCLLLKLRALFGLGPRPEVIAYLLSAGSAKVPVIARATSYSLPAIRDTLADLSQSGFVYGPHNGVYQLDAHRWCAFVGIPGPAPLWIDWSKVFLAVLLAMDMLDAIDNQQLSDYLRASRLKRLWESLQIKVSQCGMPNVFLAPITLEQAERDVPGRLSEFITLLVDGAASWESRNVATAGTGVNSGFPV